MSGIRGADGKLLVIIFYGLVCRQTSMTEMIYNGFNCKYSYSRTLLSFPWIVSEDNRKNTELGENEIQLDSLSPDNTRSIAASGKIINAIFCNKIRYHLCFSLSMIFER